MNRPFQFSARDLFITMLLVGVLLAFVAKESIAVAVATVYCCLSSVGLAIAIWLNASHFMKIAFRAINHRQLSPFASRIKWLMLDGLIFVWLVITISAANFVLQNYTSGAKSCLIVGLIFCPIAAAVLLKRFRRSSLTQR